MQVSDFSLCKLRAFHCASFGLFIVQVSGFSLCKFRVFHCASFGLFIVQVSDFSLCKFRAFHCASFGQYKTKLIFQSLVLCIYHIKHDILLHPSPEYFLMDLVFLTSHTFHLPFYEMVKILFF